MVCLVGSKPCLPQNSGCDNEGVVAHMVQHHRVQYKGISCYNAGSSNTHAILIDFAPVGSAGQVLLADGVLVASHVAFQRGGPQGHRRLACQHSLEFAQRLVQESEESQLVWSCFLVQHVADGLETRRLNGVLPTVQLWPPPGRDLERP